MVNGNGKLTGDGGGGCDGCSWSVTFGMVGTTGVRVCMPKPCILACAKPHRPNRNGLVMPLVILNRLAKVLYGAPSG